MCSRSPPPPHTLVHHCLPRPALPCPVLPRPALPHPVLPRPVLPRPVLPRPAPSPQDFKACLLEDKDVQQVGLLAELAPGDAEAAAALR